MTPTTTAEKASIRCTACGKYRKHTEYKTPVTAGDDHRNPVCDYCKAETAKSTLQNATWTLDVPCTIYRSGGVVEETSIAKALDPDGMAKAVAKRAEWAQAVATIDEQLVPLQKRMKLTIIANHEDKVAKRVARAELDRRRAAKAEQGRRKTEAIKAETAKVRKRTALLKAQSDAIDDRIATAVAEQEAVQARVEAFTVSANAKIDQMLARLSTGQNYVDQQGMHEAARKGRERDENLWKAGATSDPTLRAVYLARAEGRELDDDEV